MNKTLRDIIILHKGTINYNHMMYGSWDMTYGRNFLSFWAFFCPFTQLTVQKIKILKKKAWKYYLFREVYQNSLWNAILFLRYGAWQMYFFIFQFGAFFALLLPLTTQIIKILKKRKKTWRYYRFKQVYHKAQSYDVWLLRYEVRQNVFVILGHFWNFLPQ